jgi:hypothetical protein
MAISNIEYYSFVDSVENCLRECGDLLVDTEQVGRNVWSVLEARCP